MTTEEKKTKIRELTVSMLQQAHEAMLRNIDKALDSRAIDIDGWEPDSNPMIVPRRGGALQTPHPRKGGHLAGQHPIRGEVRRGYWPD